MLVYVLGVSPAEFALVPDQEGWVEVKELLKALHEDPSWRHLRQGMVADAAQRLAPQELELAGKKVRCKSRRPPEPQPGPPPPAHLYLGLRRRAWPVAQRRGLAAGPKGPLLLAADKETALRLGRRRDSQPVLVTVQARQAQDRGVEFWAWGEGLYLCHWLPAACLMGPALPERPAPREKKKEVPPPPQPRPRSRPGRSWSPPRTWKSPTSKRACARRSSGRRSAARDAAGGGGLDTAGPLLSLLRRTE